jgi:iron complex outermembrane receptor protein
MQSILLRRAIRRALVTSALAAATLATSAHAQDAAAPADDRKLETIVVTGSRIRSVDIETAQPVVVIDRADIEKSGLTTVADILNNITAAGGTGMTRSAVLVSNTFAGGSFVDIRGLGIQRVLVLVNGRRWVKDVEAGLTDMSTVPTAIVERIEVLKDGASAIYGSDAISAVVNIITRERFEGAEANVLNSQYDEDDGKTQTYDFTMGANNDRGSVVFNAAYTKQDPIWARDRPFSAFPLGPTRPNEGLSGTGDHGTFVRPGAGGNLSLNPGGNPRNLGDYHTTNASDSFNANQQMMLQNAFEQNSAYVQGRYDLTDNIAFRSEVLYNQRESTVQVAGYPISSGNLGLILSADSYYNPLGRWTEAGQNFRYVRPDGSVLEGPQDLRFFRRGVERPRVTRNTVQVFHFGGGFEGSFDVGKNLWNWDVNYNFNRNDGSVRGSGNIDLIKAQQALGPSYLDASGVVRCGSPGDPIADCVPWNVLAAAGGYTEEMMDYYYLYTHDRFGTRTTNYTANLTGDLVELPAGPLAFAAGYEYRDEKGYVEPDYYSTTGNSSQLVAGGTNGGYTTKELYAELSVPILRDVAFAKNLSVNIAERHSRYSNFGNTNNGKLSILWNINDDLLARANYAEGFRAPAIGELFAGVGQSFDTFLDPCDTVFGAAATNPAVASNCRAAGLAADFRQRNNLGTPIASSAGAQSIGPFLSGSNPNLGPETSTTRTAGFVYSPSWLEGFNMSIDWYKVRIENVVAGFSANQILNNCYIANSPEFCTHFGRDANGQVANLNRQTTNFGWIETEGYDMSFTQRLAGTSLGDFVFNLSAVYVAKNNNLADNFTGVSYTNGRYIGVPTWRLRANGSVDWNYEDWGVTWTARYFSSISEPCAFVDSSACTDPDYYAPDVLATPFNRLGAITFHDVSVRYRLPWKGTIQVGARNVFDKVGPTTFAANGANSQFAYNPQYDLGRVLFVQYQQKF